MLRIAGADEVPTDTEIDLCRVLHPSYGLPRRLVLALVADTGAETGPSPDEPHLAEVTRIDAVPAFLARRRRSRG